MHLRHEHCTFKVKSLEQGSAAVIHRDVPITNLECELSVGNHARPEWIASSDASMRLSGRERRNMANLRVMEPGFGSPLFADPWGIVSYVTAKSGSM